MSERHPLIQIYSNVRKSWITFVLVIDSFLMDVKGLSFLSSVVGTAVWMNERICEYFNSFYFQDVWF